MHQQVRTTTTKTGSTGPGAQYDQGGVIDILQILSDAGVNLQTAGGTDLDGGGEFVFAVHHDDEDDGPANEAAELLKRHGYGARTVWAHVCTVDDEPGALLRCLRELEATQGPISEILVGTPDRSGHIPVQVRVQEAKAERAAS